MRSLRIAIASMLARKVGGTEHYLDAIIQNLVLDHDVALWCDTEGPLDRQRIAASMEIARWTVSEIGLSRALAGLRAWKPDIVYVHGLESPAVEEMLLEIAPNIFFPHNYLGTCISGHKTWKTPRPTPCSRPLGVGCLAHFYPHRCGGLNPVTMIADFHRAHRRTALLPRYHAVLTTSQHMRDEMIRNGAPPSLTFTPPYVALAPGEVPPRNVFHDANQHGNPDSPTISRLDRLLFVGRMDFLKGGWLLLRAVPEASRQLGRPLLLTMAGDGPERSSWQRLANALHSGPTGSEVEFIGWVSPAELRSRFLSADLLVVPSVWPEPFGIVGPQAGSAGLPAAAFDVGGISEWLTDGINGHLGRADPPGIDELASAIVRCLADPVHYAELSAGAVALSQRFELRRHASALRDIFRSVVNSAGA